MSNYDAVNVYISCQMKGVHNLNYNQITDTAKAIKQIGGHPSHCANLAIGQSSSTYRKFARDNILSSDAVLLLTGYEESTLNTLFELELVKSMNLPLFKSIKEIKPFIKLKKIYKGLDKEESEHGMHSYNRILRRRDPFLRKFQRINSLELRVLTGHYLKYSTDVIAIASGTDSLNVRSIIKEHSERTLRIYNTWTERIKKGKFVPEPHTKVNYPDFLKLITKVED